MTVKELQNALSEMPQDATVTIDLAIDDGEIGIWSLDIRDITKVYKDKGTYNNKVYATIECLYG